MEFYVCGCKSSHNKKELKASEILTDRSVQNQLLDYYNQGSPSTFTIKFNNKKFRLKHTNRSHMDNIKDDFIGTVSNFNEFDDEET
jgi:hypothetical protein